MTADRKEAMDERSYVIPVRVTAHGCKSADEAREVFESFMAECARSAARHELVIWSTGDPVAES